jgi:hypothetical protein
MLYISSNRLIITTVLWTVISQRQRITPREILLYGLPTSQDGMFLNIVEHIEEADLFESILSFFKGLTMLENSSSQEVGKPYILLSGKISPEAMRGSRAVSS